MQHALSSWIHVLNPDVVDYTGTQGIIYVVDSNDLERTSDAREELHHMLTDPELQNAPLLVLANKQDLPHALSASELTDRLALNGVRDRQWFIQGSCAVSGDGLYQGMSSSTYIISLSSSLGGY